MTARSSVAVFSSGGDAQGMNAAIRGVVRAGMVKGMDVYAIQQGYQGLVDGDVKKMLWDDVSGYLSWGGTAIGTARCHSFEHEYTARRKSVQNLVTRGIDRLVCIGGDGSLTGASVLRREWPDHVAGLLKDGLITAEQADQHQHLVIVGLVGSVRPLSSLTLLTPQIDNDMALTDSTIGADTALHRIVEALDAIMTTASSHSRSFVVEVMGRNCGYLALMSALATGADWVFIPERPVPAETWKERLVASVSRRRGFGTRHSTVIVAEGAVDSQGNKITANDIKNVIDKGAGLETRVTILGHIQRGGVPSAFDRLTATRLGVEAIEAVVDAARNPQAPSVLIGTQGDKIIRADLLEAVATTKRVAAALAAKDWDTAFSLRGPSFAHAWATYKVVTRALPHEHPDQTPQCWGVLHVGAPSPGENAAVRAVVRMGLDKGHTIYGIYNGFAGLVAGEAGKMGWMSVAGWSNLGGALLGSNRDLPSEVDGGLAACAAAIKLLNLKGLVIIGGWEAYLAAKQLGEPSARASWPTLSIPVVVVPATISNNCPGTHHSIGEDTAVNTIVDAADRLKQSAVSSRRRVFVLETMGGHCGYLTLASAIAGGAQHTYLPEHGLRLADISRDIDALKKRFEQCRSTSLILNNEAASPVYTTQLISDLMNAESDGLFSVRLLILGHVQQGNQPSVRDRTLATALAHEAALCLQAKIAEGAAWVGSVGQHDEGFVWTPLSELLADMDERNRRPRNQWWMAPYEGVLQRLQGAGKSDAAKYRPLEDTLIKAKTPPSSSSLFQRDTEAPNLARLPQAKVLAASASVRSHSVLNASAIQAARSTAAANRRGPEAPGKKLED